MDRITELLIMDYGPDYEPHYGPDYGSICSRITRSTYAPLTELLMELLTPLARHYYLPRHWM
jgi:hypothetical protein